jgi:hypothetical protein
MIHLYFIWFKIKFNCFKFRSYCFITRVARFIYFIYWFLLFLLKHELQFSPNFTLNSVADSNYRGKCEVGGFLIFEWTLGSGYSVVKISVGTHEVIYLCRTLFERTVACLSLYSRKRKNVFQIIHNGDDITFSVRRKLTLWKTVVKFLLKN